MSANLPAKATKSASSENVVVQVAVVYYRQVTMCESSVHPHVLLVGSLSILSMLSAIF